MFSPHPRLFVEMAAVIRNINRLMTSAVHNSGRWRCGMKRDHVELVDKHWGWWVWWVAGVSVRGSSTQEATPSLKNTHRQGHTRQKHTRMSIATTVNVPVVRVDGPLCSPPPVTSHLFWNPAVQFYIIKQLHKLIWERHTTEELTVKSLNPIWSSPPVCQTLIHTGDDVIYDPPQQHRESWAQTH